MRRGLGTLLLALQADVVVIDGGGNLAYGNDDTRHCTQRHLPHQALAGRSAPPRTLAGRPAPRTARGPAEEHIEDHQTSQPTPPTAGRVRSPTTDTDTDSYRSGYGVAPGWAVMARIGRASVVLPTDPRNGAPPRAKTPPSAAASQ